MKVMRLSASMPYRPSAAESRMREARASVGAGFVYPICGDMRTMPGLGTKPAASIIDFDDNGEIANHYLKLRHFNI